MCDEGRAGGGVRGRAENTKLFQKAPTGIKFCALKLWRILGVSPRPAFGLWKLGDLLSTSVEGAVLEPTSVKLKLPGNRSHNSSLLPGVAVGITHTAMCSVNVTP